MHIANGQPVANFSIATNDRRTDRTDWHRIVAWGKLAEICEKHLCKGRKILVEGRIQNNDYLDRDGKKCHSSQIVADNIEFLDGPKKASNSSETYIPPINTDSDIPF
jgi:single-strand DNA-binding protein